MGFTAASDKILRILCGRETPGDAMKFQTTMLVFQRMGHRLVKIMTILFGTSNSRILLLTTFLNNTNHLQINSFYFLVLSLLLYSFFSLKFL